MKGLLIFSVATSLALALVLALVAFFHIPITKFPTQSELAKIRRIVDVQAQIDQKDLSAVKKSMEWIAGNDQMQLATLFSLRKLAVLGFLASALLSVLQLFALWKLRLLRNPFAFPAGES